MKLLLCFHLLLLSSAAFSQSRATFGWIDWKVQDIESASPDTLAKRLTAPYSTELEKVRSIFRWITEHISYNVMRFQPQPVIYRDDGVESADDTSSVLKPLNERVANIVLKRKVTVCEGYARLFKTLCDYAGIKSEIIDGYARTNMSGPGRQFRCNHKWNAVFIDSSWYLLDATWASGYLNYSGDKFIKDYNDYYFLTQPKEFIRDHYPADVRWTLLSNPPTLSEFNHTPFKQPAFSHYRIIAYTPSKGIINASVGDSITIELRTNDLKKNLYVLDLPSVDSVTLADTYSFAQANPTCAITGNKVNYTYIITSENAEWLQVIYNGDLILRYKLNVKKQPLEFPQLNISDITAADGFH
jgi:transglutaminase/protease-like cytokinesis protein 3